jgi:Predicted integral membrane protein (DUF2269)
VATRTQPRRRLSRSTRNAILTVHIIVSVGLLGDSAGFLAVAIRRAIATDPQLAAGALQLLNMFALVFGIPLSFAALITGTIQAIGSGWGLLRYPWVTTKLLLIVSVILVGAFVLQPALDSPGPGGDAPLIVGSGYDVAALALATGLGVFKPGRPRTHRPDPPGGTDDGH